MTPKERKVRTHDHPQAVRATVAALLLAAGCSPTPPADKTPVTLGTAPPATVAVPADLLNPAVTADTVKVTICRPGWAASVRPDSAVTSRIKDRQQVAYGIPVGTPLEEDHVIPLSLGGAPAAAVNLFPEPLAVAKTDDRLEDALRRLVCAGSVTLADARGQVLAAKAAHGYQRAKSLA